MVARWDLTDAPASTPHSCAACVAAQFPQWAGLPVVPGRGGRLGQPHLPPRGRALGAPADGRRLRRRAWRRSTAGCRCWRHSSRCRCPSRSRSGEPQPGLPVARGRCAAGSTALRRATASTRSGSRSTSPGSWSRCGRVDADRRSGRRGAQLPPGRLAGGLRRGDPLLPGPSRPRRPGGLWETALATDLDTDRTCGSTAMSRSGTCWSRERPAGRGDRLRHLRESATRRATS